MKQYKALLISTYPHISWHKTTKDCQDWSYIPCDRRHGVHLDDLKLSRMAMHYIISRADTTSQTYCLTINPRKPNSGGKLETLKEFGKILESATQANGQIPPLGGAWDNAGSNAYVNDAFLGRLERKTLSKAPFFRDCEVQMISNLPCMPRFGTLLYRSRFPMLGCNDYLHCAKRLA